AWSPIYVKLSVQTNSWKPDVSLESQRESYERIAQLFQSVTRPLGIVFMVFGFILLISAVIGLFGICQFPVMTFVLNCCGYWNGDDFNANGTQFTRRDRYLDYEYPSIRYPISCCKKYEIGQDADRCPQVFNITNSNVEIGCRSRLYENTVPLVSSLVLGSLGILALELLVLSLAMINVCCGNK
ncbi:hypothetical protein T265_15271, partial [Opisthorchis viverrini]